MRLEDRREIKRTVMLDAEAVANNAASNVKNPNNSAYHHDRINRSNQKSYEQSNSYGPGQSRRQSQ